MRCKKRLVSTILCLSVGLLGGIPLTYASERMNVEQQTTACRGTITDASGEPIIGASVVVKGTTNGTITDLDGNFSLTGVKKGTTLQISFVGYTTREVIWNGEPLKISLKDDTKLLDEVVVVGYGSQKKANLTGAVATVKMADVLGDRPLSNASEALQGAVPGLFVGNQGNTPGKGKSFQLRGAYSIGSKSVISPLVLIDNVEGNIDMLNPDDIESITVLKDAASSAIYGARAAGGVILVTTKRPKGEEKFQINYNNNFSFSTANNLPKQVSLRTYLQSNLDRGMNDFWTAGAPKVDKWLKYLDQYEKDPSSLPVKGDGIYKDAEGGIYYLHENDLMRDMFETGFKQQHNLSVSGGTDKLRFRLSAGYVNQNGVMITDNDQFRRLNVSSYLSADITKWFTQEANISYGASRFSLPLSPLGAIYSTRLASFYPRGTMPEGIYGSKDAVGLPFMTSENQILAANPGITKNENPRIFLKSLIKPIKNLDIAFEYTYDKDIYDYSWYTGKMYYTSVQGGVDAAPSIDYLEKRKAFTNYNAINLYATYSWDLNANNHLKFMAGFNQESSDYESLYAKSEKQAVMNVPSLGGGTSTLTAKDEYSEYSVRGGFFRVNYNYMDKYLLEVNGRYDGSSKFPKQSRFGFFPSVSAGWNITQESFMEKTRSWLDNLKFRASYGEIGNQNISPYTFTPTMSLNNKYSGWLSNGNMLTAITSIPALVNSAFTWEKVGTLNFGVDVALLNNRLTGVFEWYQRDTKGMLAPGMQLPAVVGADAPTENTADMRTRGWELSATWRDRIGKFGYTIGFNLSDASSVITKYNSNQSKLLNNFYEGQHLNEIWGYVVDGYYSVDDFVDTKSWKLKDGVPSINGTNVRPGDVKFRNLRDDEKGANIIYEGLNTYDNPGDRKIIGNSTPRFLYGITLGASYAGFDLNIFLQGVAKRDAWIANTLTFPLYSDHKFIPLYEGLDDYWKPADIANGDYSAVNPNAKFPRIYQEYANMSSNYRTSDKYLSDASYMRIKNISLSYSFNRNLINRLGLAQLKAFVNVENLATFTSLRKGIDPETLSWDYPSFRTVSFGFNVSL